MARRGAPLFGASGPFQSLALQIFVVEPDSGTVGTARGTSGAAEPHERVRGLEAEIGVSAAVTPLAGAPLERIAPSNSWLRNIPNRCGLENGLGKSSTARFVPVESE